MGKKLTTKEFIKKAKRKHREKYDYSKVEYINCQTKVCIICPEHGEFWQMPSAHIYGQGCPKCANKRKGSNFRMGKKEFIRRATLLHKGKYNYDKVEMERLSDKIIITCPIHGDFTQKASDHLIYKGCKKCSKRYMDTTYFIDRAKEVHGNKYDYSLVEISKGITKVKIKCPTHGVFEQSYADHLRGCGCWECYKQRLPEVNKKSNETFLNQLKEIYGDKYDLSKVEAFDLSKDVFRIIPAWSLGRLLEICGEDRLPISFHKKGKVKIRVNHIHPTHDGRSGYNYYDSIIDCIEWLIKEGYFNKEYLEE